MTTSDIDYREMKSRTIDVVRRTIIDQLEFNEGIGCSPFIEEILKEDLYTKYELKKNSFWRNYIIDGNKKFRLSDFDENNYKYKYTPKIYKFNDRYYIERLRNRNSSVIKESELVNEISDKLLQRRINVKLNYQKIYCINENSNYKIKFRYFRYLD